MNMKLLHNSRSNHSERWQQNYLLKIKLSRQISALLLCYGVLFGLMTNATALTAGEQTIILEPSADAWLRFNKPNAKYGKLNTVAVGATRGLFVTLFKWKFPEEIKGATIVKARFILTVRSVRGKATYQLHPVTTSWLEAMVSPNTTNGMDKWPDGSFYKSIDKNIVWGETSPPPVASVKKDSDAKQEVIFDFTNAVKYWMAGNPNNGAVLVRGKTKDTNASLNAGSREAPKAHLRPRLVITYKKVFTAVE